MTTPIEQELYELRELVAKLRDVFPFPQDKCYDKGYPMDNKNGWGYGALMSSPTDCMNEMINVCKNKTI